MNEHEIFERLLEIGKLSKDPEGVVSACLVRNGQIIAQSPSSDDSQNHAEYLVIEEVKKMGERIKPDDILFTTLEPCSDLPGVNDGRDCVTVILDAGVKNIIYAAKDPEYSTKAGDRLEMEGVSYRQIQDESIIARCANLFNSTIQKDLSDFKLPRQGEL